MALGEKPARLRQGPRIGVSFGQALEGWIAEGAVLCVGLDPHPETLADWGFPDTPEGLQGWAHRVVAEVGKADVAVAKPQVAFFERHGVAGMSALAEMLGMLRTIGVLTIGDAKRGDIGTTMRGYARAWLVPGADFEVDALTLSPYLGFGSLLPALEQAVAAHKGVFVLAATSNPEAWATQSALTTSGSTVAGEIIDQLATFARSAPAHSSGLGVVLGATVNQAAMGIDMAHYPGMPILSPGFGQQGAAFDRWRDIFPASRSVLAVAARSLSGGGPEGFVDRVSSAQSELSA
jgi:orotidine-5'-phosphate decarboxylase